MKTYIGRIVAADLTQRTMTIYVDDVGGVKGAVINQEVTITPIKERTLEEIYNAEDVRMNAMMGKP
jgi:hypothetical protein